MALPDNPQPPSPGLNAEQVNALRENLLAANYAIVAIPYKACEVGGYLRLGETYLLVEAKEGGLMELSLCVPPTVNGLLT